MPTTIRKCYSEMPWREMTGMRDKLIYGYFGVDLRRVWKTVKGDIPNLNPFSLDLSDMKILSILLPI